MAAVIRLKRRLDEDPTETLLLNCKKRKTEDDADSADSKLPTTLFQFAGTLDKHEDVFAYIKSANTKADLEEKFKNHDTENVLNKTRKDHVDLAKSSRYKVVDCKRALENEEVTILDVETETTKKEDCPGYVFDVYYTNVQNESWDFEGLEYSVLDPLQTGTSMFSEENADSSDSEDSNAENYYKNDYPDEEEEEEDQSDSDMEEMQRCMKDLEFNSDDSNGDSLSEDDDLSDYDFYAD